MIKAIIFDCFGVVLQRQGIEFYLQLEDKDTQREVNKLMKQADLGEISEDEFDEKVAVLTGTTPTKVAAETTEYKRNNEILDFLQELRGEYQISLLTNVNKETIERFFSEDERKMLFDDVVISSEVGLVKPNPEIFALAARRLALRPEECILVDDTPRNCAAAAESGIKAIAHLSTAHTIKTIKQFLQQDQSSST